ncbi:MAG: TonB family protein [Byssovorax sp.]
MDLAALSTEERWDLSHVEQVGETTRTLRGRHFRTALAGRIAFVASLIAHGAAVAAMSRQPAPHVEAPLSLIAVDMVKVPEAPKPPDPPKEEPPPPPEVKPPPPKPIAHPIAPVEPKKDDPPPPPPEEPPPAPAVLNAENGSDANPMPVGTSTAYGYVGGDGTGIVLHPPAPPPPPPAPPPPPPQPDYAAITAYARALSARVASQALNTDRTVRQEHHGSVKVMVVVASDGAVRQATVVGGDGDATLQAAAISAVRRAGRFGPPPPSALRGDLAVFNIPVNFGI